MHNILFASKAMQALPLGHNHNGKQSRLVVLTGSASAPAVSAARAAESLKCTRSTATSMAEAAMSNRASWRGPSAAKPSSRRRGFCKADLQPAARTEMVRYKQVYADASLTLERQSACLSEAWTCVRYEAYRDMSAVYRDPHPMRACSACASLCSALIFVSLSRCGPLLVPPFT